MQKSVNGKKMVSLTIDGKPVTVPEGTLVVDAAKKIGIDIPVFCYHPKMEPVGMCRLCLVQASVPVIDRTTGAPALEADGSVKMFVVPKLETACTMRVVEGMAIDQSSPNVLRARRDILEFLLTSHPLDCPVCDKGGECPLQNLTMNWGPGESRFDYSAKMHLAKHIPLGELIYLDRERCIQCGRCVRFQETVVEEPVIGFFNRGRRMEIISFSEPGFDSYWSGNTTDICPVGALTTADFRFKARPWELNSAASLCTHCPVGCNTTVNVRREAASGGEVMIKRVMPRQNEQVNEIWICDKGRFGYHYAQPAADSGMARLQQPLVRKNGELTPVSWDEALSLVAERFEPSGTNLLTVADGRLANEDLFNLSELTGALGGQTALYTHMGGGELTQSAGLSPGSNLGDLGAGSAILVVASDLEEEAPLWWLRVKQAAERGAALVVLNPRPTRLDGHARHLVRYAYGSEAAAVLALVNALSAKRPNLPEAVQSLGRDPQLQEAAREFSEAENLVIFYGSDGLGLTGSQALAQACTNLLLVTGHLGQPNNGLVGVWRRANDQGAWEMGWRPIPDLAGAIDRASVVYLVAADPVGDDPRFHSGSFGEKGFIVVQELFLTPTARLADVVLPAQSWAEREGSLTSGERRVQRFYPAIRELEGALADYKITARIAAALGIDLEMRSPARVFQTLADKIPAFNSLSYANLSKVEEQWPLVGRSDMYYGGTTYDNQHGLGITLPLQGNDVSLAWPALSEVTFPRFGLLAVPVTRLYDHGTTLLPSLMLKERIPAPYVCINPVDAERLHIHEGAAVRISPEGGIPAVATVRISAETPEHVLLAPRSYGRPGRTGLAIEEPVAVEVLLAERAVR